MSAYRDGGRDAKEGKPFDYDYGQRNCKNYSFSLEVRQTEAVHLQKEYEAGRFRMVELLAASRRVRHRAPAFKGAKA